MFDHSLDVFYSPLALDFYKENEHQLLSKLLLKHSRDSLKKDLSLQLESRRRADGKLPTWLETSNIVFPPKLNLEQASSEQTASFKAKLVKYNTSLDLTAGTGVDSWQFSKNAKKHTLVEADSGLVELAKHNFGVLGIKNTEFVAKTAEGFIAQNQNHYDLIYIDPSRRKEDGSKAIALEHYSPNVIEMQQSLLASCNHLLIKVSPFADITYLISSFPAYLKEVNIVALSNECKEILLLFSKEHTGAPVIKTVNLDKQHTSQFSFFLSEELQKPEFAEILDDYLFEPNAAVLKAGAFNALAKRFGLKKLQENSHLYTAKQVVSGFPGKTYKIIEDNAAYKLKGDYNKVSIATRNFPDKPESIRKRLKMSDGNDFKLFATSLQNKKVFIVGTLVHTNHEF